MEFDHLILAAGKSSRMGFPKGLLRTPGGENFLLTRARCLREFGARNTILVVGFHREKILKEIGPLPDYFEVVVNPQPGKGQTSSFKCALDEINYSYPVLMELVDQPPLSPASYSKFISGVEINKINIPVYNGDRGHPPLFPGWFLKKIDKLSVNKGINSLYSKYNDQILEISVNDSRVLMDLDTSEEYDEYHKKFS